MKRIVLFPRRAIRYMIHSGIEIHICTASSPGMPVKKRVGGWNQLLFINSIKIYLFGGGVAHSPDQFLNVSTGRKTQIFKIEYNASNSCGAALLILAIFTSRNGSLECFQLYLNDYSELRQWITAIKM